MIIAELSKIYAEFIIVYESNQRFTVATLSLLTMISSSGVVITFAKDHPEQTFFVTKIGCGIAGFSEAEISPLFKNAHGIANIILPRGW